MERTHTVMEEWGYTGSACVPMALHDAREKGKIQAGDLVVLVGSGSGLQPGGGGVPGVEQAHDGRHRLLLRIWLSLPMRFSR